MKKINKLELDEIIREEVVKGLKIGFAGNAMPHQDMHDHEEEYDDSCGEEEQDYVEDPDGYEGSMAKNNLHNAAEDAKMLISMIAEDENLEPWVEEKIAVASAMINSVARHLRAEKTRK